MDSYTPYVDEKTSKDDVEKTDLESSTTFGSQTPTNEEDTSLLAYKNLYKRQQRSREHSSVLYSVPLWAITGGITIVSLLAMNIATLILLQQQPWRHGVGHLGHSIEPHKHESHSAGADTQERLSPEGLRIASNGKLLECGEKARDAEANGCIFDIMSFEWTPPACYDEQMLLDTVDPENILAPNVAGVFPWYRWANFTEPLDQRAEVLSAFPYVWTNQDWHKGHCLYMWRLLVKAENQILNGEKDIYVPAGATNHAHIAHCNLLISDKVR
ncbi:MAG: hypothetical protein Q9165_002343 [Trypethelium subeluteriae]